MKKIYLIFASIAFFLVVPQLADAATMNFSPSSSSVGLGSNFTVTIRVNTQGADVNTAEANISYSTNTLELVSVRQGSTFYLTSPGSPARGNGTAYFGGGLPTPGYNGSTGVLGTMTFRAKALGNATVSVTSGKVLLNDGNGTDAYSGGGSASFTIIPPPVGGPVVTSTTHPSPEGWYAKPDLTLSWSRPDGAHGFSFELDQKADTVPDNELDTTITTTKSYPELKDGVWYFHIKARGTNASAGFGPVVHYKVQVDTQKPLLFDIKLVGQANLNDVTRTPTIEFEATDDTSGVAKYSVSISGPNDGTDSVNGTVSDDAKSPYTFEKLVPGPHLIRVTAFDAAGNQRKAELPIIVTGPGTVGLFDQSITMPSYLFFLKNILILILILIIIWLLFRRRRPSTKSHDAVSEIQAEIDHDLEELKQKINDKLLSITAKTTSELLSKEEKVAKEVTVTVGKTRKNIDKKIGKLRKNVRKDKDRIIE